jgi:hypothetical protein
MPEIKRAVGVGILPLGGRLGRRGQMRMKNRTAIVKQALEEGLDPEVDAKEILKRLEELDNAD